MHLGVVSINRSEFKIQRVKRADIRYAYCHHESIVAVCQQSVISIKRIYSLVINYFRLTKNPNEFFYAQIHPTSEALCPNLHQCLCVFTQSALEFCPIHCPNGRLGQDLGFGGSAFALKLPELLNRNLVAVRAKLGQTSCFPNGPQIWCPIGQ